MRLLGGSRLHKAVTDISAPVGKTVDVEEGPKELALPVGLEILALPLEEKRMLAVAAGIEVAILSG